jgi:hypothetical protein
VRRFVIFLGLFSLLSVSLLVVSAGMVQTGILRTIAHGVLGWGAAIPLLAYLVLSLRMIIAKVPR